MILNSVNFIRSNLKITNNPKLLIVGMGYKDGVSDLRNSPSMELQKYLLKYNFDVFYYDDLITNVLNTKLKHLDNKEQINHIENIVVCQKTSFFKKIKFNLNNKPKNIFDLNNILSKKLILKIQSSKSKLHILGS
jgi:UDP-N-acetyl-D-mannosaminuronate dehydrogenase